MSQRLFIVHGFEGDPHGNWFDWLAQQARAAGLAATQLRMPNPAQPVAAHWQQTLDAAVGTPDADTFLVGHSLGCISLLHFLSRRTPAQLGGLVLAAGFARVLPRLPQLDAYIQHSRPDYTALAQIAMPVHCVISRNDTHVPPALSEQMAQALHGRISWLNNGGHLMAEDSFTELPVVWAALQAMLPTQS